MKQTRNQSVLNEPINENSCYGWNLDYSMYGVAKGLRAKEKEGEKEFVKDIWENALSTKAAKEVVMHMRHADKEVNQACRL